jgi:hypothetical protein
MMLLHDPLRCYGFSFAFSLLLGLLADLLALVMVQFHGGAGRILLPSQSTMVTVNLEARLYI